MMTAMIRSLSHAGVFAVLLLVVGACARQQSGSTAAADPGERGMHLAAGGLVEPADEERIIIPQLSGRLARVYVDEGDTVTAGQLIAEIENDEYRATLAAAEAQLALRGAELDRLRNGARPEEIAQAVAVLDAARVAEALARAVLARTEPLSTRNLVSADQLDRARAELDAARAERTRADAALALLRAGARIEDIAIAEAARAAAVAERDRASAQFEKSRIRSPVDGSVLKRDLREGETVVALSPLPLARIGDLRRRFVRADIEELDIARVRIGQHAEVTSDAFAGQRFAGTIVQVSQRMGRRNQTSGNPAEKQDAKVLQALIELAGDPPLPIGLRVDVFIDAQPGAE